MKVRAVRAVADRFHAGQAGAGTISNRSQVIAAVAAELDVNIHTLTSWVQCAQSETGLDDQSRARSTVAPPYPFDALLTRMYGHSCAELRVIYGLGRIVDQRGQLSSWGPAASLFVGSAPAIPAADSGPTIVVTALRLGHTAARVRQLRYDLVADIILAIGYAHRSRCDCLIYLPVIEQAYLTPELRPADWLRYARQVEHLTHRVIDQLHLPHTTVTVVRTDTPAVRDRLDHAIGIHHGILAAADQSPTRPELEQRRAYLDLARARASIVVAYLPATTTQILRCHQQHRVIAVDDLKHASAVTAATAIAHANNQDLHYLARIPAPAADATAVMRTTSPTDALILGATRPDNNAVLDRMHEAAHTYWSTLWQIHAQMLTFPINTSLAMMAQHYRRLIERLPR